MQSSAQEVTMLFKLIAAAMDSWACLRKMNIHTVFMVSYVLSSFHDIVPLSI